MTRYEAIKILHIWSQKKVTLGEDWASLEVDKLRALGILKLEEEKSPEEKFKHELSRLGYHYLTPEDITKALNAADLKLSRK